jgi:uncharacterized protein GlcG (DUF336 family)
VRKFSKEENMDSQVKVPHRRMSMELAQRAAMAAGEKAKQFGKEISIAVVDESGHLVYFARGNSSGFISFETSNDGVLIGAIGCGGATSEEDHLCAEAAAAAIST